MKQYLLNLHTSEGYNRLRNALSKKLYRWGILNDERRKSLIRFNNSLKSMLMQQQNIFEGMNIRYFGPVDGHDVTALTRVLKEIKDMKGPKLLHVHTRKGKGFKPAEEAATVWHAPRHIRQGNGRTYRGRYHGDASIVPRRIREYPAGAGTAERQNSGCHACHAFRMFDEHSDEGNA